MFYTAEQTENLEKVRFAYLLHSLSDFCFTITLNRPEKKNAMNPMFMREIAFALTHAKYNREIRVVVLKANGSVFCAGADLKALAGNETPPVSDVPEPMEEVRLGDAFIQLFKPCIAKVHAPVYAGGFLLLGGCTHVIAADQAVFGLPEVNRGLWPFQVMASLMPLMPARTLLDWCMRARVLSAAEALTAGLITELVAAGDLDDQVEALSRELASKAPLAIQKGMEAFHAIKNLPADVQHAYLYEQLQGLLKSEDAAEGLKAFGEKRTPQWKGR
jgi:enoyl-CoA hydratase/carnithine racemase